MLTVSHTHIFLIYIYTHCLVPPFPSHPTPPTPPNHVMIRMGVKCAILNAILKLHTSHPHPLEVLLILHHTHTHSLYPISILSLCLSLFLCLYCSVFLCHSKLEWCLYNGRCWLDRVRVLRHNKDISVGWPIEAWGVSMEDKGMKEGWGEGKSWWNKSDNERIYKESM